MESKLSSDNSLKESILKIFEIKQNNFRFKIQSLPKVYSSTDEVIHFKDPNFKFTEEQKSSINQRLRDVKIICDALFDLRKMRKFDQPQSFKLGKKYNIRLQKENTLHIDIQQIDLVLLRLMPEENPQLQETFLGTCQIFYYLESAIRQCEKISNIMIKNKLREYKIISQGGYLIFETHGFQKSGDKDFQKFEEFYTALLNLGMSYEGICHYLEILISIVLFGGLNPKTPINIDIVNSQNFDISSSMSTVEGTNEISEINFQQLLKLDKNISQVDEIKEVENKQTTKVYLQCQDKLRGSQYYLFQQLYEWTLNLIHKQNPPKDLTLYNLILFEKQTPIYYAGAERPNHLFDFVDFIQNFSIDYITSSLCNWNKLNENLKAIVKWFETPKLHTTQQLIESLNQYNNNQNLTNSQKKSLKLQHTFGQVSYHLSDIQKSNNFSLNEEVQAIYRKSENIILKKFQEAKIRSLITLIINNLKDFVICDEPTRNFNSNSSSPRSFQLDGANQPEQNPNQTQPPQ